MSATNKNSGGSTVEDKNRRAELFNDIGRGPVELRFSQRIALSRWLMDQGWSRVQPEGERPAEGDA